jgi:hypothetical protein
MTMEIPLQEALFPVSREIHPCWEPRGLKMGFHHEGGGDMFLPNIGSYKNHTTSSYPRTQNSSWLHMFTDVNALQLQKAAHYKVPDNSVLDIMVLLMTVGNLWQL